jgi:tight adherence protein C
VNRLVVGAGLLVWVGTTLLLSQWDRASRPSLANRLRPYSPAGHTAPGGPGILSVESMRDVIVPLMRAAGDRLAALAGVSEPLNLRLRRVHSPLSPAVFRMRQMTATGVAVVIGAVVATAVAPPLPLSLLLVIGLPILTFLVIEQRLAWLSDRWKRDMAYELPVVSEQLAMLLNAGYSLGAALSRLAARGQGCVARDLAVVVNRVKQGVTENHALKEWAEVAGVEGVERLVAVLTLHSEAADLGRLVSTEARQARRDLHRRTIEAIERKAQQVWVPVTVATLVPGVILLAVPFLSALRLFSNA